jgi:hypothetical protein
MFAPSFKQHIKVANILYETDGDRLFPARKVYQGVTEGAYGGLHVRINDRY